MMNDFILYKPNDMVFVFSEGITFIDPLSSILFNWLGRNYGYVLVNNIFIILSVGLCFFLCYTMFNSIILRKNIIFCLSLLFAVSIYLLHRIFSLTVGLYFVLIFPLFVILLVNKKDILVMIFSCLFLYISNYYWFFVMFIVLFWYVFDMLLGILKFSHFVKKIFLLFGTNLLLVLVVTPNIFFSNLTINTNYKDMGVSVPVNDHTIYRPIEDWYNLSFRPWYFFIPPKSSIFFGEFSKNIHKKIQNTGHYLADDYMEEEMAGSYMGWHFLIGLGIVVTLLLIRKFKGKEFTTFKSVYENREIIYRSFFIIFCILLISGPPSFTIKGIKIYTPTYLLYYIVPVFRTLVRWAVVIYLFVLIINSFLVQDLYNLMKNKFQKILFIISFLSLNFVIFAIKIPVININKPPQEIAFVKEKYPESVPYAVYPKGDYYSIFWAISHKDLLINPVNVVNYETGFDSNEFSKKLITQEGIKEFLKHNPKYLIYYPENISDKDLEKINKINNDLRTKEDIRDFFKREVGTITYVGNVIIFEVR